MKAGQELKYDKSPTESTRIPVVSLRVDVSNYDEAIRNIASMANTGKSAYVCMSTVHMVMESHDNPEYGAKVNAADMILPDGMPLVWMQKLQGIKNPGRVRGNDLMIRLFAFAEENDLKVGFYGGKQVVIDAILERAGKEYPNLRISYAYSPPFRPLTPEENRSVVNELAAKRPDVLFTGLGCPKQEKWMSAQVGEVNSVMIGVGAAFDFYAGKFAEAPMWLQNLGLEWLYRLSREPKRLWRRYLILNPRFIFLAISQLLGFRNFRKNRLP